VSTPAAAPAASTLAAAPAFLGTVLIWSATPLAIQWGSTGAITAAAAFTARVALAVVIGLSLLALLRRRLPGGVAAWRAYAIVGINLFVSMNAVYWAAERMPSGLLAVTFALTPFLTVLLAQSVLGDAPLRPRQWLALWLALSGVWVLTGIQPGLEGGAPLWLPTLAVLVAVAGQAGMSVALKRWPAGVDGFSLSLGASLIMLPGFVALAFWQPAAVLSSFAQPWPWQALAGTAFTALFGSLIGFTLYFYALDRLSPTTMSLLNLLTPVLAVLLGVAINGELFSPREWLGMALILAGLAAFLWRPRRHAAAIKG